MQLHVQRYTAEREGRAHTSVVRTNEIARWLRHRLHVQYTFTETLATKPAGPGPEQREGWPRQRRARGRAVIITIAAGVSVVTGYARGRRRRSRRGYLSGHRGMTAGGRGRALTPPSSRGTARDSRRDSRSTWALRRVGGDRCPPRACAPDLARARPTPPDRTGASALTHFPRTLTSFFTLPMDRVANLSDATCTCLPFVSLLPFPLTQL